MIRTARSYASLATAAALVLGGAAIAAAAPGLQFDLASEETGEVGADPDEDLDTDLDEDLDPALPEEEEVDPGDPGAEEVDEVDEDDEVVDPDLDGVEGGEDADEGPSSAFATWVQSIPSDWGCVRGRVISAHAAGDKTDFAGPSFDSIDAAIEALGLEGRCVDVARARVNGADDEASPQSDSGDAQAPSARRGPPAHAQGQRSRGAGPATGSERAEAGPPAGRGNGGPPAGRGGR